MRKPHGGGFVAITAVCQLSDIAFIGLPSMPCCLSLFISRYVLERFTRALPRPAVIDGTIDRQQ
jgi:hypothetical protein